MKARQTCRRLESSRLDGHEAVLAWVQWEVSGVSIAIVIASRERRDNSIARKPESNTGWLVRRPSQFRGPQQTPRPPSGDGKEIGKPGKSSHGT
jgi:hypothetical protein